MRRSPVGHRRLPMNIHAARTTNLKPRCLTSVVPVFNVPRTHRVGLKWLGTHIVRYAGATGRPIRMLTLWSRVKETDRHDIMLPRASSRHLTVMYLSAFNEFRKLHHRIPYYSVVQILQRSFVVRLTPKSLFIDR